MKKLTMLLALFVFVGLYLTSAQTVQITGTVTSSEDGQPLPGTSVTVKGTTIVTTTDFQGKYTLSVPSDAQILEFRFIGMKTQELAIAGQTLINVTLIPEAQNLDEIVVTALGISRQKKALGYSVQDVKSEEIARSGEKDVINSLSSKIAGIQVISTAGTPGASSKILIRGNSSFTGNNQPLIVIDGIPIDNSTVATVSGDYPYNPNLQGVNNSNRAIDINPDDVESVSVLKGATAAALYGAQAANGAIVYTTKRGKIGAPKVVYGFTTEINKVSKLPEEQHTYVQGSIRAGVPTYQPGATPNSWGPSYIDANIPVYDNTDEFFKTGVSYDHNLSITGGNEATSFRTSISRLDQTGIIPTTRLERTSLRLNADTKVTKNFTMSGSLGYTNTGDTKVQNGSNLAGIMLPLMRCPISFHLNEWENADGSSNNFYPAYDNPYWSIHNNPFKTRVDRFVGNTLLNYNITKGLSVSYRLGADVYADKRKQIFAIGSNAVDDLQGQIEENTVRFEQYYQDVIVTHSHDWSEKFHTDIKLGGNLQNTNSEYLYGRANQLSIPDFYNINNGAVLYSSQNQATSRTSALFFDASVAWSNYLFIDVTGRNEWSSTFGRTKNNFFYPSVGGSFVFSEILPKNDVLTFGKIRASLAYGGNSPGPYSSATYYVQPYFADGFTDGTAFPFLGVNGFSYSNVLGNSELEPEKTKETEFGLDAKFLESRIGFEFTYYQRLHTDLLVLRPLAGSSGFQYIYSNSGSMRNRGIEIVINLVPVKYRGLVWKLDVNYTKNVNKVLSLAEGVTEISIESGFTGIGSYAIKDQPYGVFYGSKWLRNDNGQLIISQAGGNAGIPLVDDTNGNIGNPYPDWTSGIRNTLEWKGLSLSALLDIKQGGKAWCGTIARMSRLGRTAESVNRDGANATYVIEGVADDGSDNPTTPNTATVSALNYFSHYKGDGAYSAAENAVYSTSWVRLREVSLTYHYNLKSTWFKFVEFSFVARNLWLKTDYPGVDPETSLTGAGSNLQGFDYFNNPSTKSFSFGIKFGLL
jgi:TonB-linked SusC/RagA family outer membrane protein